MPINYALNPPPILSDAQLLKLDPVSGVYYPRHHCAHRRRTGQDLLYTATVIYSFALFVWTLYW